VQKQDSTGTTKPVWDGENVVVETDQTDTIQVVYTLEPAQYGNLVSQIRGSTTSYGHFDGLGSTDRLTDGNANVTDSYTYQAFGAIKASAGSTVNPFRYVGRQGYYYDADPAEYYLRARQYEPATGRFLSRDVLGYGATNANLYRYAHGSPVNLTDPGGLQPSPIGPFITPIVIPLFLYCRSGLPVDYDCGKCIWTQRFFLNSIRHKEGALIQKVRASGDIYNCEKPLKRLGVPDIECWEAFPVAASFLDVKDDDWGYDMDFPCTKGIVTFTSPVGLAFYEGISESDLVNIYKFTKAEKNPDCPIVTTKAYTRKTTPNLPAATTNAIARSLVLNWDCCKGPKKTKSSARGCGQGVRP
jgi:RHS repeat-associated protein